jgi:hypothetical protein
MVKLVQNLKFPDRIDTQMNVHTDFFVGFSYIIISMQILRQHCHDLCVALDGVWIDKWIY